MVARCEAAPLPERDDPISVTQHDLAERRPAAGRGQRVPCLSPRSWSAPTSGKPPMKNASPRLARLWHTSESRSASAALRRTRDRLLRSRPRFDTLEDRQLLSGVFTVSNTNDSGPGSLRAAILASDASPIARRAPRRPADWRRLARAVQHHPVQPAGRVHDLAAVSRCRRSPSRWKPSPRSTISHGQQRAEHRTRRFPGRRGDGWARHPDQRHQYHRPGHRRLQRRRRAVRRCRGFGQLAGSDYIGVGLAAAAPPATAHSESRHEAEPATTTSWTT